MSEPISASSKPFGPTHDYRCYNLRTSLRSRFAHSVNIGRVPQRPISRRCFLTLPPGCSCCPAAGVLELELGYPRSMSADLESALVSVWQQTLIDKKKTMELDDETYLVMQTAKNKLRQVDFRFGDLEL